MWQLVITAVVAFLFGIAVCSLLTDWNPPARSSDADPVDPWVWQRQLMEISGQRLPNSPKLTKDVLLYAALVLEESSEMMATLHNIVGRLRLEPTNPMLAVSSDYRLAKIYAIQLRLKNASSGMRAHSGALRQDLATFGPEGLDLALEIDEAVQLLDDTTDLQVVNSGLSLAAGLPGPEGYVEIVNSNFSKADPETGFIEKDSSGKWIKGRDYRKPDLQAVLYEAGIQRQQPDAPAQA